MKKTKRFLSLLLALVMTFSVVFIGTGGSILTTTYAVDPPIVPRVADTQAIEGLQFEVPDYLTRYGTNSFEAGNNIAAVAGGVKFYVMTGTYNTVTSINLSITDSTGATGVLAGTYSYSPTGYPGYYVWDISGGTVAAAATYVKFELTYSYKCPYNGDTTNLITNSFTTTAVSALKQTSHPATNNTNGNYKGDWSTHESPNRHYLWANNSIGLGTASGATVNGYVNFATGAWVASTAEGVSGYKYDYSGSGSGTKDVDFPATGQQTGVYYVDRAANSNLNTTDVQFGLWAYNIGDNHRFDVTAFRVEGATLNGSTVTSSYALNDGNITGISNLQTNGAYYTKLSGAVPAAGETLYITMYMNSEGNTSSGVSCHFGVEERLYIRVISYDKTTLNERLANAVSANRQAKYYTSASWSTYYNAFIEAYRISGDPTAVQTDINTASANLYTAANNLVYTSGDYSTISTALAAIPAYYFSHPEYYTDATRSAVDDAIADINYGLSGAANVLTLSNGAYTINNAAKMSSNYQTCIRIKGNNLYNAVRALTYKNFNLDFNTNGGSAISSASYKLFANLAAPVTNPTRPYYEFNGWYEDASLQTPITNFASLTMPYGGKTVYAGWTLTAVTVSFVENGGSVVEDHVGGVGEAWTGPTTTPTRQSYVFVGWYYDDITFQNAVNWSTFTIPDGGVTLYAKWDYASYVITFNSNGGSAVSPITAKYTSSVARPADPTRTGFGFIGWYLDSTLNNAVTWPFTMTSYNITLYAKWNQNGYTVIFNSNGGSAVASISSTVGAGITQPTAPTRDGYQFLGWYYDSALTDAVVWSSFRERTGEINLYAKWNPYNYTISFDSNGGSAVASMNLPCGSLVTPPTEPTLAEYVFAGWYLEAAFVNAVDWSTFTVPSHNLVLVAKWDPEPDTATFTLKTDVPNTNSDGTIVTGTVEQGDIINVTVGIKTNYIVASHSAIVFYDNRYFEPALNGNAYTAVNSGNATAITNGFITLVDNTSDPDIDYNIWGNGVATAKVNSFTPCATYYPTSWRASTSALSAEYANYEFVQVLVSQSSSSINNGYAVEADPEQDFIKFQLKVLDDAPVTTGSDYASILIPTEAIRVNGTVYEKNMKTYATKTYQNEYSSTVEPMLYGMDYVLVDNDVRLQVEEMTTGTINLDAAGGTDVASITDKVGKTIVLPTPERQYYIFQGWSDGTNIVNASAYVIQEGTVNLTAIWEADVAAYTVQHYKQKADLSGWETTFESENLSGQIGSTVTATPKTYTGFSCSNSASGVVLANGGLVLSLYYTRNSHTITFNSSGGSAVPAINAVYGATISAPTAPTRPGYTFSGWYYGNDAYTFTTMPGQNLTLVAQWTQEFYNVNLYGSEGALISAYPNQAYGTVITLSTPTAPENYRFAGWYKDAGYTVAYADTTYSVIGNQNFYAKFELDGYTVNLYVNNELKGEVMVLSGDQLTKAAVDEVYTVPTGYNTSGWLLNGVAISLPYTVSTNISLYATVTIKRVTFYFFINDGDTEKIYYDGNDGQDFDPTYQVSANYGNTFIAPTVDEFDGFEFDGWYTDPELQNAYTIPSTMPEEGLYLYGTYNSLNAIVSFDLNGGTGTTPDSIDDMIGANIILPSSSGFSRTYYDFAGWSTSTSASGIVTSFAIPEGGATLHAIWTRKKVTITFSANGGEGTIAAKTVDAGSALTLPAVGSLSRTNYTFGGWALSESGAAITSYTTTESDAILYAVWNRIYVTITYNTAGTGTIAPASVAAGDAVDLPDGSTLSKTYYSFAGWSLTEDGPVVTSYTATEADKTLYAIWTENEIEVVPAPSAANDTIIDTVNGIIYGVGEKITLSTISEYVDVSGNGYVDFANYTTYLGTGTIVYLKHNGTNEIIGTYYLVVFGDLNGDGMVTAADQSILKKVAAGSITLEGAAHFAADVNGDKIYGNSTDYTFMKAVLKGKATIDQKWGIILA